MAASVIRRFLPVALASLALTPVLSAGRVAVAGGSGPRAALSRPQLEIRNGGPAVQVVPWKGARAIFVACGGDRGIDTKHAPNPPWHLAVRNARTRHLVAHKIIRARSGYVTISIDRRGMQVTRNTVPSSGPPPGCSRG